MLGVGGLLTMLAGWGGDYKMCGGRVLKTPKIKSGLRAIGVTIEQSR